MAKKVLILSSSPRRGGNSDVLCDEFMKGALEEGNEVEKIFLKDRRYILVRGAVFAVCTVNLVRRRMMQRKSWRR